MNRINCKRHRKFDKMFLLGMAVGIVRGLLK